MLGYRADLSLQWWKPLTGNDTMLVVPSDSLGSQTEYRPISCLRYL